MLIVFIRGDVIVEDRAAGDSGACCWAWLLRACTGLWEREEYFGALSADLAQSQPPPHQGECLQTFRNARWGVVETYSSIKRKVEGLQR